MPDINLVKKYLNQRDLVFIETMNETTNVLLSIAKQLAEVNSLFKTKQDAEIENKTSKAVAKKKREKIGKTPGRINEPTSGDAEVS